MKKIFALLFALAAISVAADARKVSGTVMCGEEKLSGVIVTDGKNFTQTDKGKFKLEIEDNAEFVYIVTPAGFVADWSTGVPAFYQAAEGKDKFHFELQKTEPSEGYSIIAVADPQTKNDAEMAQFLAEPMEDLCKTVKEQDVLTVGLALGDICYDTLPMLEIYKKEIVRTGIPFYPVVGNHDHEKEAQGDINTTAAYRKSMGPENYAFFIGKDVVMVLDNIIYDTQKKYQEGYAPHVLSWVKGLEALIPESADIYIAQHSPILHWDQNGRKIINSHDLIGLVHGHEVHFISGHTHINNFFEYGKDIYEHNVASICGSWWSTLHCTDGTPRGYKVFTKKDDALRWYYKSVDYPKDFQAEMYGIGQTELHPNSVVLNVWDWDPQWKVEWYQDGVAMGDLEPVLAFSPIYVKEINEAYENIPGFKMPRKNYHYFAATPSQYAKNVMISVESRFGQTWVYDFDIGSYIDVQARIGGDDLTPDKAVEAVRTALDMGVNTLNLDFHVTMDGQVKLSHKDGADASEIIDFVENYTAEKGMSPVRYNVEIKSKDADGEGRKWPTYDSYVRSCALLLHSKHLEDRIVVQSFDTRALRYMEERYPEFALSYLLDVKDTDYETFMKKLKGTSVEWLSPHVSVTDEDFVRKCHEKGMRIAPWGADTPEDIKKMTDLKVDAVISECPEKVLMQTRLY